MKMNFKVRFNNPYFWIGLVALIFASLGIDTASLTSWDILVDVMKDMLSNPFKIGCMIVAVIGYFNDPTTKGLKDSNKVMSYTKPRDTI